MGIKFGAEDALSQYESSLVLSMDPGNTSCFAGPPTNNENGTGIGIYNNQSSHITVSLSLMSPVEYFRGAPVYKWTATPTTSTGVGYMTGGNNPGLGVVHNGGGGPAATYTGHSIFFKPMFPTHSVPIYTHYSNISGWQSTSTSEYIGDGWYRAYTTFYNVDAKSDGKYWAINPKSAVLDEDYICYWAGPFREQQPQNSLAPNSTSKAVNPYCVEDRPANYDTDLHYLDPYDSVLNHGGVADLSGRGNGMNVNGHIRYDEDGGGSILFTGNAWLITHQNPLRSNSNYFTLEAWAKTLTGSGWQTVLGTESTLRQIGFNNTTFYAGGNGGGGNAFLNGGSISTDTWYHLVMTFDGKEAKLYKDGVLVNSGYIGFNSTSGSTPGRNMIGSYSTGGGELLNGKVGIARVYETELTAEQILANYNATKARYGK